MHIYWAHTICLAPFQVLTQSINSLYHLWPQFYRRINSWIPPKYNHIISSLQRVYYEPRIVLSASHTLSLWILITPYEVDITIFSLYTYAHEYIIILNISTQKLPSGFNREVINVLPLNAWRRHGFHKHHYYFTRFCYCE